MANQWALQPGPEPACPCVHASSMAEPTQSLTILDGSCLLYPVCEVSNKVEEEVILRDTDDLGMKSLQPIGVGSDLPTDIPVSYFSEKTPLLASGAQCVNPTHTTCA